MEGQHKTLIARVNVITGEHKNKTAVMEREKLHFVCLFLFVFQIGSHDDSYDFPSVSYQVSLPTFLPQEFSEKKISASAPGCTAGPHPHTLS